VGGGPTMSCSLAAPGVHPFGLPAPRGRLDTPAGLPPTKHRSHFAALPKNPSQNGQQKLRSRMKKNSGDEREL